MQIDTYADRSLGWRKLVRMIGLTAVASIALVTPHATKAATITQADWVHGTSAQIEWPSVATNVVRSGYQLHIEGKANWIHFAVPTPVIVSDRKLSVTKVGLLFHVASGAYVRSVHVYDGPTRIAAFDGLNLSAGSGDAQFFVLPTSHVMSWGLGISVYYDPGVSSAPYINLFSAGGDFQ